MLCRMDGFFFKPKRWTFSVLVLQNMLMLLLLTESYRGQSLVVGPSHTITALVGEDVILPCHLEPAGDAVSQTVEWGRPDLEPRFVHVWHEGKNLLDDQNPLYKGRTSMSVDRLRRGDLSLKLSALTLSDNGVYRCYFPSLKKHSNVQLVVGSFPSSPIVGLDRSTSGVVLQCESAGWFPEPELLWLDSEGKLLSAGSTESVRAPGDLYTVSSRVTVERRHNNMFTCRVTQNVTQQTRDAHVQLSGDMFLTGSSAATRVSVIVIISLSLIVAAVVVSWRWNQNRRKEAAETLQSESERAEREQLMAGRKIKEEIKERLEEELKRKEEEQTDLEQMILKLTEQNKELNKQLEKVKEELEDWRDMCEEFEKKTESAEETADRDKDQGCIELKKITSTAKKYLNRRKQEDQNRYTEIQKLRLFTAGLLKTMLDRKTSLEEQKKKVKGQLEDIERRQKSSE